MPNPLLVPLAEFALESGRALIDRLWPDRQKQATQRAAAEAALLQVQSETRLKEGAQRLSAILAEAASADPWTSRARPSFMYVMYLMILAAIPMGVLHAVNSAAATEVTAGMQAWLAAIPSEMWWLFGAGYLGYTGARTVEKRKGVAR